MTFNADMVVAFYSETPKFFFQITASSVNKEGKKDLTFHFEMLVFEYVERNRNKGPR